MPRKKSEPSTTSEQDTWREDASKLSYEEALQALDVLLGQLQDDSIPLAELQRNHARASIYLDRCDLLLSQVEQSVRQLDPNTMEERILDPSQP
ncbi:exodeoxyribonuclease VII small subunit [Synechococcus sp. ROS8604]|jgi:exodeoxyribonuclease VII small subunit|uniref:exodeoxyribonuclease VII small subunit n=1 Tax=Synechococcus sp. ROS8604 TaxID=1442557 RepID=UPI0016466D80|nr:exodeoxyribonuclease VII small subunit [Synechococcus sp. ROS8604]QNI89972.1 exodeoxyribonuclease VII/ small subunit [Synechococcus sp. ROS8604]